MTQPPPPPTTPPTPPPLPTPARLGMAIRTYLQIAYDARAPKAIRDRVARLYRAGERLWEDDAWEIDGPRRKLRLGNRFYPHMKLVIEPLPDHSDFAFRADTHDAHCDPGPTSPERAAYRELVNQNQSLAREIETAWEKNRLPTFRGYLKRDIARRRGKL